MMDSDSTWDSLIETEREYYRLRHKLWSSPDAENGFRAALKGIERRGTALRVLQDAPVELIAALFTEVFDLTLGDPENIGPARAALLRLNRNTLLDKLHRHIEELLNRDDLTDWEYRRACELLEESAAFELLRTVVEHASTSSDPDIIEVAEDYQ
ncbi:hypothetical protein [Nocardia otitidiscaviarum]|uniref:hypothetical protein n=1 Tax=Nocardia otitidiscaviarum TaxID=1823 RepID=UPI001895E43A|nr:hypothetical protein [Nocardia otitidiscaviarum]MBF6177440.1 hypothetical protein [Nocardia otitidiscaviarum]